METKHAVELLGTIFVGLCSVFALQMNVVVLSFSRALKFNFTDMHLSTISKDSASAEGAREEKLAILWESIAPNLP